MLEVRTTFLRRKLLRYMWYRVLKNVYKNTAVGSIRELINRRTKLVDRWTKRAKSYIILQLTQRRLTLHAGVNLDHPGSFAFHVSMEIEATFHTNRERQPE